MTTRPAPPFAARLARVALFLGALLAVGAGVPGAPSLAPPAQAAPPRPEAETRRDAQALKASQAAVGRLLTDRAFTDPAGRAVRLSDFRGRPLVINMVYSSCAQSCPVVTTTLQDAAEVGWDALGKDAFHVITVGFDAAADTPGRMGLYADRHGLTRPGWTVLSGDLPEVVGLTDDLGFTFFESAKGFDHIDQVTIVDAEGRVYRQVYGDTFDIPLLVEPLKALVYGTHAPFASLDDLWNKVRLFCTVYDPAAERYRFDFSMFYQMAVGLTIILSVGFFVVRSSLRIWARSRAERRRTGRANPA
ncbi:MAG: SCO family protein [Rhodobacterales bacterium]|nr:SCO family protein [Rhodobacterales bacterium]